MADETVTPTETPSTVLTGTPAPTGDGKLPEWLGSEIPDDLKSETATLSRFKSPSDLAKSYVHLNKKRNDQLVMPGEDAKPEDWEKFYQKLGRPESPDKYELKLPEGAKADENFLKAFKETAHKHGILPKQAQNLLDWYNGATAEAVKAHEQAQSQALEGLKQELGVNYDKEVESARLAVQELLTPAEQQHLVETGKGNDPFLIKLMARMGKSFAEPKMHGDGSGNLGQSPEKLKAEIAKIRANPGFWDKTHPEHKSLLLQDDEVHKQLYPDVSA